MYIAGFNSANTNGYDIYLRTYAAGITDCNDPNYTFSDVVQSGLAATGACTCTTTACSQNQGYNMYTVSSTGLPLLNYFNQNQFVFPFIMTETFTTTTCTDQTKRQLIVISPGTGGCTTGTSVCSAITYQGVSVGRDTICTNSPAPSPAPSLKPVAGSVITTGFMQLSVYTSSPCNGLPVGYQYKQLGLCSCSFGYCSKLSAIANSATGIATFIMTTWGSGLGGTLSYDCTGTPTSAVQSVNTTSCMSIPSTYTQGNSGDWSVSNNNNGAFLAIPKLITTLPPAQSGMIATYGYNSQAGCTAATLANMVDVTYQNAACTKDYTTPSGNYYYTNYCPSTTAPQAVTR